MRSLRGLLGTAFGKIYVTYVSVGLAAQRAALGALRAILCGSDVGSGDDAYTLSFLDGLDGERAACSAPSPWSRSRRS